MRGLIPRVKVNYTFFDFLLSLFVRENTYNYRNRASQMISSLFNGRPVMLTGSGRIALYHIFIKLPQKKVLIPAYTCPVVAAAALHAGKEVVYVPTNSATFNSDDYGEINSDVIVVATHQYGYPCNIKEISKKCRERGAVLIEDAAAAINTFVDGQRVGTYGDYAILSFNHSKQITVPCGGGCIIARSKELLNGKSFTPHTHSLKSKKIYAFTCILLKNSFIYNLYYKRYLVSSDNFCNGSMAPVKEYDEGDYNNSMSEWQSFLLIKQLKKNQRYIEKRRKIFVFYNKMINNPLIRKPIDGTDSDLSRYVIQIPKNKRMEFYERCITCGVDVDFSHTRISSPISFVKEHNLAEQVLNLPFYYSLSFKEAKKISIVLNSIRI